MRGASGGDGGGHAGLCESRSGTVWQGTSADSSQKTNTAVTARRASTQVGACAPVCEASDE